MFSKQFVLFSTTFYKVFIFILFFGVFSTAYAAQNLTITDATLEIKGLVEGDKLGERVFNSGNVNGIGGDDLFLGAPFKRNESEGNDLAGTAYLVASANLSDGTFDLNNASADISHTDTSAYFSRISAGDGDLDGDGRTDFIIGNIKNSPKELNIYLGKDFPSWSFEGSLNFLSTDINITNQEDNLPSQLSLSGDVNGDGYDDLLVGADVNLSGVNDSGSAMLVFGREDFFSSTPNVDLGTSSFVDVTFKGISSGDGTGYNVAIIPDINGDGYDEVLISAYNYNTSDGFKVFLIYGRSDFSSVLTAGDFDLADSDAIFFSKDDGDDGFGESIAGLGDINGDGYGDFAISAPSDDGSKGAVYLYYGSQTQFSATTEGASSWSVKIAGETAFFYLGLHSLSGIGDVNGDLLNDIAIGEYWNTNKQGSVYVIYGKSEETLTGSMTISAASDLVISGVTDNQQVGYSVSSGGDIDDDGVSELLIGANRVDSNKGAAYIFQLVDNVTPNAVSSISLYSDSEFTTLSSPGEFSNRDWVYVEAAATDGDSSSRNIMEVVVSSDSFSRDTSVRLRETAVNSGLFRGQFKLVRARSSFKSAQISAELSDTVTITSKYDIGNPSKTLSVVNAVPIISDITASQEGTSFDTDIIFSYVATDYDNDLINFTTDNYNDALHKGVQMQYSSDRVTWVNARVSGDVSELVASENGTLHDSSFQVLTWDVVNDIGVTDNLFYFRLRPHDGTDFGEYVESDLFHVDNIPPVEPVLSSPPSSYAQEITVTGSAEAGTTILIYVNDVFNASATVGSDGIFEVFPVIVSQGALIKGKIEDNVGFQSGFSNIVSVSFSGSLQTLSDGDIGATLTIPLNAIPNNRTISFVSVSTPAITVAEPGFYEYIDAFNLTIDDGEDITTFSESITVELYLSLNLPAITGVSVNYLDTETDTWKSDGITLVSVSLDSLVFTTTHFTQFAVMQLQDPYPPIITSVQLDGALAVDNAFVDESPIISAEIQDSDSGIATWSITVQKQGSSTVIDSEEVGGLSSSFNMQVSLTLDSDLEDDAYQTTITAIDGNGGTTTKTLLFNVNTSSLSFEILHAPNPFNPQEETMTFGYSISQPIDSFEIYILSLRRDTVWHYSGSDSDEVAGYHSVIWDGKRDDGRDLPNGVYYAYCIVKSGNSTKKKRLKIAILR
jgi:flagellar hook assembly protein FlgD